MGIWLWGKTRSYLLPRKIILFWSLVPFSNSFQSYVVIPINLTTWTSIWEHYKSCPISKLSGAALVDSRPRKGNGTSSVSLQHSCYAVGVPEISHVSTSNHPSWLNGKIIPTGFHKRQNSVLIFSLNVSENVFIQSFWNRACLGLCLSLVASLWSFFYLIYLGYLKAR